MLGPLRAQTSQKRKNTKAYLLQALGCGPGEHEGHVRGLLAAKKEGMKAQKSLMEELAALHGHALAEEAHKQGQQTWLQRTAMPLAMKFVLS